MRNNALPYSTAMFLVLAACSGGGSGGSTPGGVGNLPAPSPTPTANTTLTDLKVSQSFANDATGTDVTFDLVTGTGISGTSGKTGLTISYDAVSQGYTVTADGRSETFAPADVQSTDAYQTIFRKAAGNASDTLTLVKIPYSGRRATQYVGLGYWQHNILSGARQETSFQTFTYGLPTPAGAVPRTGTAGFRIDAFGLVSAPGREGRAFQGSGDFSVDFGAGLFSAHAYLTETELVSGDGVSGGGLELTGAGQLSASDGSFSGNALYEGALGYAGGAMNGKFYGPNGEELGASFSGSNAQGMAVAGSFTGQRDPNVKPQNLTLTNMTQPQLFYTQFGYNSVGQLNWQNAETFTYSPPTSAEYGGQFTINDKVASEDPNFTTYRKTFSSSYDSQNVTLELYKPGAANTELALTYASFGHWATVIHDGRGDHPLDEYFAYGIETPARLLMGKTGTGHYQGVVYGTGSNQQTGARYAVKGSSRFDVDFSAQNLSGALSLTGTSTNGGANADFGSFDFNGPLSVYLATTSVALKQNGQTWGQLDTRFFGPDGQEIAGPFSVFVPQGTTGGTSITGVTAATRR